MIPHALALAALLIVDAGGSAATEVSSTQQGSAEPFAWLLGHWTGSGYLGGWTERDQRPPRGRRPAGLDTLNLTFTTDTGKIRGVFYAVSSSGRRKTGAELVIDPRDDYPLVWREAGLRYRFHLNLPGKNPAERQKSLDQAVTRRDLSFLLTHGPTKRVPYPAIIELELLNGRLSLRRYKGPQHGAMAADDYGFERAP